MKEEEYKAMKDADNIDVMIDKNKFAEEGLMRDELLEDNDLNHGFPVDENPSIVKSELASYVDERLLQLGINVDESKLNYLYSEYYAELVESGLTEEDYEGHDDLLYNALDRINAEKIKL